MNGPSEAMREAFPAKEGTMGKYRKKPVVIEAIQWFKNGDHPEDRRDSITGDPTPPGSEGQVVRRYNRPRVVGYQENCSVCGCPFRDHGWIDTLESGHRVCPSDWIITGVQGEQYPCKPDIFLQTYEPA